MAGVEVQIEPFNFPNFLRVKEWKDHTYPVSMLNDQMAAEYWDELKPLWLAHVKAKRDAAWEQMHPSSGAGQHGK